MPTLNVIFHGLFLFVEEPYRFVAAVPAIADHQIYLIGVDVDSSAKFYGRGTFELLGTKPAYGPSSLSKAQNAKIRNCEVFTTAPPARSVFILPRPESVFSCRCMSLGTDLVFFGKHASEITCKQFATINVLSYSFDKIDDLRFTGLPDLDFHRCNHNEGYVNVGIISSGAHDDNVAVSAAFDKMMADLAPTKDIHMVQINLSPTPSVPCAPIPGVTARTFDLLFGLQLNDHTDDCVSLAVDNTSN
jgi:hypothetical protein